jgi:hypothetical protein
MSGRFQRGGAGWERRRRAVVGVGAGGRRTGTRGPGWVGMGRVALSLFSVVCVGWCLIELPALLFLDCEVDHRLGRDTAWRGLERGRTRG